MAEPITVDDLMEAFRQVKPRTNGGGIAVSDIAEKTGKCAGMIRLDIRRAIAAGLIEVDFEARPSIDGRQRTVPVYRLVKGKKK